MTSSPVRTLRHVLVALGVCLTSLTLGATTSGAAPRASAWGAVSTHPRARCPWVAASRSGDSSPGTLAGEVLSRMTLAQKVGFVTLHNGHDVENFNTGVPSLCLPALTLTDGPSGLAGLLTGVTQLPAPLGVAASFDPSLAEAEGRVLGAEARTKGFDVVQAPDLNLARVPLGGRNFETFGEDPLLAGELGAAEVEGIQDAGVLSMVKHFTAYTQETARARLNQDVSARALAEVYDVPFRTAIEDGHAAAVMCASGLLNGVRDCDDRALYATLASWGFTGFVRSDLRAVPKAATAFEAGLDLIKSTSRPSLLSLVRSHSLPVRDLNRAVRALLSSMFAYGLIGHPRPVDVTATAATPAHARVALRAAEEGVVLLKDEDAALPLSARVSSVAVIGTDAAAPLTAGRGSSHVIAPFVLTPLTSLRSALGRRVKVSYVPGEPATLDLGGLHQVSLVSKTTLPVEHASRRAGDVDGGEDLVIEAASNVTNAIITADAPGTGRGWSHWRATLRVRRSGEYEVSVRDIGDTWFSLDGRAILSSPGLHAPVDTTTVVRLRARRDYTFAATWFSVIHEPPPSFGIVDVTPSLARAVRAARRAKVAVVFVDEPSSEGADQSSFNLPGDQNLLIERVARANPHTVVVMNTANAVMMPWLDRVRAVLEGWFPGEEGGRALAAVLTGRVDPSGRLPITFPSTPAREPMTSPSDFPGVDDTAHFGFGPAALDIGYRWYLAHHVAPLFAFGFGLAYTTFRLTAPVVRGGAQGLRVTVEVTNTGHRAGADVVEAYVRFPAAAAEPPESLGAFARVSLAPGASRRVTLEIPPTSLRAFLHGQWRTVPGAYTIGVGSSSEDLPLRRTVDLA